ncbi:hypothetical protein [Micromonospora avicenniae]|uniref:Uncharacterized protein n=1 Tax=Micromonospora avicenniae TaxID=1198245 RepID=A0A1N6XSI2_9ACTN|nr:hypothetical protein [Micromonospora avicenniae]SIR05304.1 hypothetical protein SAMN05444858_1062 [Micromonospora avicenniae]
MSQPADPSQNPYPSYPPAPSGPPAAPVTYGPPSRPPSRTTFLQKVLIAVGAVVVLFAAVFVGTVIASPAEVDSASGDTAGAVTGTGSQVPSQPAAADPDAPGRVVTIAAPQTLGGRPKIDLGSEDGGVTEEVGLPEDSGVPGVTAKAQGLYGDIAKQDIVIANAVASTGATRESRLSLFISGVTKALSVGNFTEADPGPLGGQAFCGDGNINGVPAAVCVWSDAGSTGALVHALQSQDKFRTEFPALRAEIEQAS